MPNETVGQSLPEPAFGLGQRVCRGQPFGASLRNCSFSQRQVRHPIVQVT